MSEIPPKLEKDRPARKSREIEELFAEEEALEEEAVG
jgi:hypothetical protein